MPTSTDAGFNRLAEPVLSGHPEQCADFRSASSCSEPFTTTQHHEKEVNHERAFSLCTGDSCWCAGRKPRLTIWLLPVARAMKRRRSPGGLRTSPSTGVVVGAEGISAEGYFSKLWDGLPQTPDMCRDGLFKRCRETCPAGSVT